MWIYPKLVSSEDQYVFFSISEFSEFCKYMEESCGENQILRLKYWEKCLSMLVNLFCRAICFVRVLLLGISAEIFGIGNKKRNSQKCSARNIFRIKQHKTSFTELFRFLISMMGAGKQRCCGNRIKTMENKKKSTAYRRSACVGFLTYPIFQNRENIV